MTWTVEFQEQALKELERLDKAAQRRILRYFAERIEGSEDPCRFGKALTDGRQEGALALPYR